MGEVTADAPSPPDRARLAIHLSAGLVLGAIVGLALHHWAPAIPAVASSLSLLADVFLRLIKMIVAPLVLATLISGIARMGNASTVGRVGLRAMAWFVAASLLSLVIGVAVAVALHPGQGLTWAPSGALPDRSGLNLTSFVQHIFPTSIFDAMARNEVLQVVVFSLFAGLGLGSMGERGQSLIELLDRIAELMFKVTSYVVKFAPIGVFGAVASVTARHGGGILLTYGALVASFYAALAVLWLGLIFAGWLVLGRRLGGLLSAVRAPALIAFSTASSEAAYPQLLTAIERFGVPNRLAGFVLPLGYSFNLDGTMMYCTFAIIFLAQVYGVHLGWTDLAMMTGMLFITGKGIASVPRGSLVIIAATLPVFGIPAEAVLLILAVDQFLDMGRSGTNIIGNAIAVAAVARFERCLEEPKACPISPVGA